MTSALRQNILLAVSLFMLMVLTRGSHVGSTSLLPDATLACMMLGGMLLQRSTWFVLMMSTAVAVDAFAVGVAGVSNYCWTPAYWALLPTYAVMWIGGYWLEARGEAFSVLRYSLTALAATSIAFIISTDSFYLLSGRVPEATLWQALNHGWEYFPAYLGYTMMYLAVAWGLQRAISTINTAQNTRSA